MTYSKNLGHGPIVMKCPYCKNDMETETQQRCKGHCWLCCFLMPLVPGSQKITYHYCSYCGLEVGSSSR